MWEHAFVFVVDGKDYVYLLGMYLGDGCVSRKTNQLVITLDNAYPGILLECARAIESISPNTVSIRLDPRHNGVRVYSGWKRWPLLFPQVGPGRKHKRPIVLASWQWELVRHHRERFIRGLIHSDGCRTVNRFKTKLPSGRVAEYEYVRYFFSNLSADIRRLFCAVCDELEIRWTQSNPRNISVSHRDSVAILEDIVGPKR
jgi:hypothetical protein